MQELITMLERKYPGSTSQRWLRSQMPKLVRNFNELGKLRTRRPEIYEAAVVALVDWYGSRAFTETAEMSKARESRANALKWHGEYNES